MLTDNQKPPVEDGEKYDAKYGKADFRHGYWWHFEDGDDDITINGATSSKEYIYINDEIVSEKIGLKFHGHHEFSHQGADYVVDLKLKNFLTGKMDCLVYKDGGLIGQQAISFFDDGIWKGIKRTWPFLVGGFVVGYAISFFDIAYDQGSVVGKWIADTNSEWLVFASVAAVAAVTAYSLKKKKS